MVASLFNVTAECFQMLHDRPFHVINDAASAQAKFNESKEAVPRGLPDPALTDSQHAVSPESASTDTGSAYQIHQPQPTPQRGVSPESQTKSYYFVHNGAYFFCNTGNNEELNNCSLEQWIYNASGWSETGRVQFWRWSEKQGKHRTSRYQ